MALLHSEEIRWHACHELHALQREARPRVERRAHPGLRLPTAQSAGRSSDHRGLLRGTGAGPVRGVRGGGRADPARRGATRLVHPLQSLRPGRAQEPRDGGALRVVAQPALRGQSAGAVRLRPRRGATLAAAADVGLVLHRLRAVGAPRGAAAEREVRRRLRALPGTRRPLAPAHPAAATRRARLGAARAVAFAPPPGALRREGLGARRLTRAPERPTATMARATMNVAFAAKFA